MVNGREKTVIPINLTFRALFLPLKEVEES